METPDMPPPYAFGSVHPTSPPMTPGSYRDQARYVPQTIHTSPAYKRMGLSFFAQSPPLEFIEPIGQGPHFLFSRPQSRASSRPSTASGRACATSHQESEDDSESDIESTPEPVRPPRRVFKADFVLEELDSDPGYDSDIEVLRPDQYEDASSEHGGERPNGNGFIDQFKELHCQEGSSDEEERKKKYQRKKKRWSAGIFKRTYSQSVEGDSSYSDNDPLDDVDSSARRLRRRVRGPGDLASLVFEDKGFANADNIVEVDEPEDGRVPHSAGPPSIPSDDWFRLDELPFWDGVEDSDVMEVELFDDESSNESSDESSDEDEDEDEDEDGDEDEDEDIDSDSS